jgi:hypothetical protein
VAVSNRTVARRGGRVGRFGTVAVPNRTIARRAEGELRGSVPWGYTAAQSRAGPKASCEVRYRVGSQPHSRAPGRPPVARFGTVGVPNRTVAHRAEDELRGSVPWRYPTAQSRTGPRTSCEVRYRGGTQPHSSAPGRGRAARFGTVAVSNRTVARRAEDELRGSVPWRYPTAQSRTGPPRRRGAPRRRAAGPPSATRRPRWRAGHRPRKGGGTRRRGGGLMKLAVYRVVLPRRRAGSTASSTMVPEMSYVRSRMASSSSVKIVPSASPPRIRSRFV